MNANRLQQRLTLLVAGLVTTLSLLAASCGGSQAEILVEPTGGTETVEEDTEPVRDEVEPAPIGIEPLPGVDYLPLGARPYIDTDAGRDTLASLLALVWDSTGDEAVEAVDMNTNVITFAHFDGCEFDSVRAKPSAEVIRIEVQWNDTDCESERRYVLAFAIPRSGQIDGDTYEIVDEPRVELADDRPANDTFVRVAQIPAADVPDDFTLATGPEGAIGAIDVVDDEDGRLPEFVDGGSSGALRDIAAELDGPAQAKLFALWDIPNGAVVVSARFDACDVAAAWAVPSEYGIDVGYQESGVDCASLRPTVAVFAIPSYIENELGGYEITADTPVAVARQ